MKPAIATVLLATCVLTITAHAANQPPTLTAVNLIGGQLDTPYPLNWVTTLVNSDANDAESGKFGCVFKLVLDAQHPINGTLTKNGAAAVNGMLLAGDGIDWIWTPPVGATGNVGAFHVVAWDGAAASTPPVLANVNIAAQNHAPTLSAVDNLIITIGGGTSFPVLQQNLLGSSDAADEDGNSIKFKLVAVTSGTLTKNGAAAVPGTPTGTLNSGETWVWVPAPGASGFAVPAFTIKASDGLLDSSTAVPVTFNLWNDQGWNASVQVSATASAAPAQIALYWPLRADVVAYAIHRKTRDAVNWGAPLATVPGNATGYIDSTANIGEAFEYRVTGTSGGGGELRGHVYSGIEVPLVEDRGTLLLVIENTYSADAELTAKIQRLKDDLTGDGWKVTAIDCNRGDPVASIKNKIVAACNADSAVKAVFLLGHVPVPESGNVAPDGHGGNQGHQGAWPADVFLADLDGAWTDNTVDYQSNPNWFGGHNKNIPGDGKYDQSELPSAVDLAIGRVDLHGMGYFETYKNKNELALLKQYLDKDHNFRHKLLSIPRRGIVDDNSILTTSGYRNFSALFGAANVDKADLLGSLGTAPGANNSYLCAYGFNSGTFIGCADTLGTVACAEKDPKAVFTLLCGSYFGDWNYNKWGNPNASYPAVPNGEIGNLLRAPLATTTCGLACVWAAIPDWHFQHMGMGETIGFSAKLSQNATHYSPSGYNRGIWIALMGDPTLRLHPVAPPSNFNGTASGTLTWTPSADTVLGYNVYRASSTAGPFTRLNGGLISGTTFTDNAAPSGTYTYMVKAIKLELGSGTYYNSSQGIFTAVTVQRVPPQIDSGAAAVPNPAQAGQQVSFSVAASDVDTTALSFMWDFGDGTFATTQNPKHSYANAGTFSVTVTVGDGSATAISAVSVLVIKPVDPVGETGASAPIAPTVSVVSTDPTTETPAAPDVTFRLQVASLSFAVKLDGRGRDSCNISGNLLDGPEFAELAGKTALLDIGGVAFSFLLDARGNASGVGGRLKLWKKPERKGGPINSGIIPRQFKAKLQGSEWSSAWHPTPDTSRQFTVTLMIGGKLHAGIVRGTFTSKNGRAAKFKSN